MSGRLTCAAALVAMAMMASGTFAASAPMCKTDADCKSGWCVNDDTKAPPVRHKGRAAESSAAVRQPAGWARCRSLRVVAQHGVHRRAPTTM